MHDCVIDLPKQQRPTLSLLQDQERLVVNAGGVDSLSDGLGWTLVDESAVITIRFELENNCGGPRRTLHRLPGSQKVRGSNPLGSTKFLRSDLLAAVSLPLT